MELDVTQNAVSESLTETAGFALKVTHFLACPVGIRCWLGGLSTGLLEHPCMADALFISNNPKDQV